MIAEFVPWSVVVCSSSMRFYNICRLQRLVIYIAIDEIMSAINIIFKLVN